VHLQEKLLTLEVMEKILAFQNQEFFFSKRVLLHALQG